MDEVTTGSERSLHRRAGSNLWPELTLAAWEDTRATVH
jgi:hypothetical protein